MNTKKNIQEVVQKTIDWYNNLNESDRDDVAVFTIIGDMKKNTNSDFIAGGEEDIVMALVQSMINDEVVCELVKAAVEVVDTYEYEKEQKELEFVSHANTKYMS